MFVTQLKEISILYILNCKQLFFQIQMTKISKIILKIGTCGVHFSSLYFQQCKLTSFISLTKNKDIEKIFCEIILFNILGSLLLALNSKLLKTQMFSKKQLFSICKLFGLHFSDIMSKFHCRLIIVFITNICEGFCRLNILFLDNQNNGSIC